ncbi:MAG: hypothetical protein EAX96_17705 [Candidatus Lokiarchaeota archaeon]|nr:hypothetical protein [Candidatus Lokiarchaeota archaeon]
MNEKDRKILIVGGGKVGSHALQYCRDNNFAAIVVDENIDCYVRPEVDFIENNDIFKVIRDIEKGESALVIINLKELINIIDTFVFDYIIPAIPVHLLGKLTIDFFLNKNIKIKPSMDLIQKIQPNLDPTIICSNNDEEGIIVASYMPAGIKCAPNCIENIICPITKIEKPKPLFEIFQDACMDFPSKILQSKQLIPNLGGFPTESIKEFLDFLYSVNNNFLIGTSCMCHGIINAFEIK